MQRKTTPLSGVFILKKMAEECVKVVADRVEAKTEERIGQFHPKAGTFVVMNDRCSVEIEGRRCKRIELVTYTVGKDQKVEKVTRTPSGECILGN